MVSKSTYQEMLVQLCRIYLEQATKAGFGAYFVIIIPLKKFDDFFIAFKCWKIAFFHEPNGTC